MPTLCRLAEASGDRHPEWEGRDIWPLITGMAASEERTLYWRTETRSAIRMGDWKLITDDGDTAGRCELYNIASDPHETRDRARDLPDRVAALRKELLEQRQRDDARRLKL
jgi:arylsulfatase A-like enzyme